MSVVLKIDPFDTTVISIGLDEVTRNRQTGRKCLLFSIVNREVDFECSHVSKEFFLMVSIKIGGVPELTEKSNNPQLPVSGRFCNSRDQVMSLLFMKVGSPTLKTLKFYFSNQLEKSVFIRTVLTRYSRLKLILFSLSNSTFKP